MNTTTQFQLIRNQLICDPTPQAVLVTSSCSAEGKSYVSEQLGQSLTAAQYRVATIRISAIQPDVTYSETLVPQQVITLYEAIDYPYQALVDLLQQLYQLYDFVVVDGLSLNESPLTQLMTRLVAQVIFVVNKSLTRRSYLNQSKLILDQNQVRHIILVNNLYRAHNSVVW